MERKSRIFLATLVLLSTVCQFVVASTCYSSRYRLSAYTYSSYLTSPNYPFNYYANRNCYWYIAAPSSSMVVKVTFSNFNLEQSSSCSHDYIEFRDGSSSSSTFMSRYCGSTNPPTIYSTGQYLHIRFRSDLSLQYSGFRLSYTAVYPVTQTSGKCSSLYSYSANNNIQLTADRGTIMSPNYPLNYPNNIQCTWKIAVQSGKTIKLTFDYMNIEPSLLCINDYLQVRNGHYSTSSKKGDYCGTTRRTIYSSGRYLWIRFKSNYLHTYKGFKLSYSVQESGSSSVGLIIGVLVAIVLIIGIIVGVVYCMKKKRRPGVVVHNTAPSTITATTITTHGVVNPPPQGPPQYGEPQPYPQKGQPYPGPPAQGQPNTYPGPPPPGQPYPYPGPPPPGQSNTYPGPPPLGQQNPYPGPPPPGQQNPYPGPPPPGYPNTIPGAAEPYPGGPAVVSM